MIPLTEMRASNARISTALPEGLVGVFVGATRGIGATSVKQFAKNARKPRVYIIGRSLASAQEVIDECKALNSEGDYVFMAADVSLIHNVDEVCREVSKKEQAINLLFMTPGTLTMKTETSEKLHYAAALNYYSRTRFILQLLPLLQAASHLRRVVTVFAGTKEGAVDTSDFPGWKASLISARGHFCSMITFSLEILAKKAPEVSFMHVYPGPVKTDLGKDMGGIGMKAFGAVFSLVAPLFCIPFDEAGERETFLATSGRYPPRTVRDAQGVPLSSSNEVAKGTDGKTGTGVYSVGYDGSVLSDATVKLLAKLREEGVPERLWDHTEREFKRVTIGSGA
ncbi:hypothetical protein jhhlp_007546 [Lomentospora prolificans]|uniref:Ketoreductase (KR) domain-containing protein n=1 Tax=Lomentospora prolificans TaxID=41688 RepID=A0A2N3MZV7_9PEZI|nr:hypothetical protein jhhlp_007546 [Lomentospora prolificans]